MDFETFGAREDQATVTSKGESLQRVIEGVLTRSVVTHVDHRGRLFEVMRDDPQFWAEPVVHSYVFTIRTNTIKGWGVHEEKSDRYCLLHGEALTLLYDARIDSPTRGLIQEVALSPEGTRQVLIPPGVWHLSINLAEHETVLLNHPTRPYKYEAPDRLTVPWNSPQIPVDVNKYLPRQFLGKVNPAAER